MGFIRRILNAVAAVLVTVPLRALVLALRH
jgi:hypothetical protein